MVVDTESFVADLKGLIDIVDRDFLLIRDQLRSNWNPYDILPLYLEIDLVTLCIILMLFFSALCLILSLITNNYSHVDRLWSIVPSIYVFHFTVYPFLIRQEAIPTRQIVMQGLSLLWSLRLTYNFWRKGGYSFEGEDYRWAYVRKFIGNWFLWFLFNVFFICLFQHALLMLITLPAYVSYKSQTEPFGVVDYFAVGLFLLFLALETVADEQQWRFQLKKYALLNSKKKLTGDYKSGFLKSGLFKYSRHPNFFGEISLWWSFYIFSIAATGKWINYSIIGAFILTLLFQGSTLLTEYISASKYPEYRQYQEKTSRFLLLPPRKDKRD